MSKQDRQFKKGISHGANSLVKMVWYIMAFLALVFLIAFLLAAYFTTTRSKRDYEIRVSENTINNVAANIKANIDNYKDLSRLVMLNESVTAFLRAPKATAGIKNDARFGVMDVLNVCHNLDSVFIFRNDQEHMNNGRSIYTIDTARMSSAEWVDAINSRRGGAIISIDANNAIFRSDKAPIITLGRAIYDINTQKQTGILLLNFSTDMLKNIIAGQEYSGVCILSTDGEYLAGQEELKNYYSPQKLSTEIVNESERGIFNQAMISYVQMEGYPFVIICKSDVPSNAVVPGEYVFSFILLMVVFIFTIAVTVYFVTRHFTRPIMNLANAMKETRESGWMKRVDVKMPNNEIGNLADNYNGMIEYLNDLFVRQRESEQEIQKAQIRVLQEQIKPHFLYNSLECINCMAMEAEALDVQKAIETLGSFYRNSLSKGNREITLKREIGIIRDYMYLQRLRYGDDLKDDYDVAEETLNLFVPKLVLQPLVENSIYHGIRLKGEEGIIRISSWIENNELHLSVYDSGVGMSEESIKEVLEVRPNEEESKSETLSGFGLKGTIKRIRYYANNDDAVSIRSENGEFTEIEITLPILRKELM